MRVVSVVTKLRIRPVRQEEMVERLRAPFGKGAVTLPVLGEQQRRGSTRARRQRRGDRRAVLAPPRSPGHQRAMVVQRGGDQVE